MGKLHTQFKVNAELVWCQKCSPNIAEKQFFGAFTSQLKHDTVAKNSTQHQYLSIESKVMFPMAIDSCWLGYSHKTPNNKFCRHQHKNEVTPKI